MYKKTFMVGFAGLASAGSWSGSSMPSCWNSCFSSNGVTSEAACCGNDALSKCIHDTCSSADDQSYWTWYDGYCGTSTTSTVTTPTSPMSTTTTPVETSPIQTTPTTTIPTSPIETSPSSTPTPTCWTECFQENNVQSESDLCGNTAVDSCIQQKCSSADDKSYWTWYGQYCPTTTSSTQTTQTTPTTTPVSPTSPTTTSSTTTTSPATSTPTCWTECFQENNVQSESDLCGNTAVDSCIQQKCSSADDKSYWSWYDSFCPSSSTTTTPYTSTTSTVTTPSTTLQTTTTPVSPTSPVSTSPSTPTPTCWTECFQENNVKSEEELCGNTAVDSCIQQKCSCDDDKAYWSWYLGFCPAPTSPTSSTVTPTSPVSPTGPTPTGGVSTTTTETTPAGSTPTADCWSACFAKYNVQSEASLCSNDQVSACIHDTCSAEMDKAYWVWYDSFCSPASSTSVVTTTTSSVPVGATTPVVYTTTYVSTVTIPSSPKVTPTGGLPTPYQPMPASPSSPAGPVGGAPSYPAGPVGGAPSAPAYGGGAPSAPYPSSPAGAVPASGYPSGTAAASGSWPSASYGPVAATGGAASNKAGLIFAAAMALIALF